MPWKVTDPMCERAKFVALHDEGLFSMSELCQRFGVSRRVGYKWLARFEQGGLDGLRDQSRKPNSSPKQTCPQVQQALLQARRDHPTWGPKKLLAYLQSRRPGHLPQMTDLPLPAAASTVGELLKQHGLSQPRKHPARSWKHPGEPALQADAPPRTRTVQPPNFRPITALPTTPCAGMARSWRSRSQESRKVFWHSGAIRTGPRSIDTRISTSPPVHPSIR